MTASWGQVGRSKPPCAPGSLSWPPGWRQGHRDHQGSWGFGGRDGGAPTGQGFRLQAGTFRDAAAQLAQEHVLTQGQAFPQ